VCVVTADLLQTVVAAARRAAEERARRVPAPAGGSSAGSARGRRFVEALSTPGVMIIAECKRRSPSRGILRREYNPGALARGYERAGAAAISVLTEPTFFDGSLDHLASVRRAVDLPLLRKDFIVTEYQVAEARGAGADAVLLIVAALARDQLGALLSCAAAEGLAALVEVHDARELDRALEAGATLVGVNSRDLRTLEVDPSVFEQLAGRVPDGVIAVAESGLRTAEEIRRLADLRYDAFLIGERLMIEPDPERALAGLVERIRGGGA
jgi:indole-3-glycerol phosphate synthase